MNEKYLTNYGETILELNQRNKDRIAKRARYALVFSLVLHACIGFLYFAPGTTSVESSSILNIPDYMMAKMVEKEKKEIKLEEKKKEELFKKDEEKEKELEKKKEELVKQKERPDRQRVTQRKKDTGGGDVHSRVVKKGVLGMLSGRITGRRVGEERKGRKIVGGMEQVLRGIGDLAENVGAARFGMGGGIGFGTGFGSGFGGGLGGEGIEDLLGRQTGKLASGIDDDLRKGLGDRAASLKDKSGIVVSTPPPSSVSGTCRTANEIAKVVRAKASRIKYCYDKGLKVNPDIEGKLLVKFKINPAGRVVSATIVSSSLNSSVVENCVTSTIMGMNFNAVPGCNTIVNYPFTFSIGG